MTIDFNDLIPHIEYFADRACSAQWVIPESLIDFHDLTYVTSGEATYILNGEEIKVKKGDLFYAPKGSLRSAFTSPHNPMSMYATNFQWINTKNKFEPQLPFDTVTKIDDDYQFIALYQKINTRWLEQKTLYIMESKALFSLILSYFIKLQQRSHYTKEDVRINKIKEYIIKNYALEINMSALSSLINVTPNYLSHLFKKNEQQTLSSYINNIRINHAENIIMMENSPLSQVAERCGFKDVFYFSKVYKQIKGVSPSASRGSYIGN